MATCCKPLRKCGVWTWASCGVCTMRLQELKKDYSLRVASQRTLEYGQVVLSADNIFNRCRQKSHIAHPPETNPLQQLEIIGSYVSDLLAICKQKGVELGKS